MTLKLVHTFGKHAGSVQTLDKDIVRFGRSPDGDVVFDPEFDRDASGSHAEARRQGSGWLLVDMNSRNGTFVNGDRVSQRRLSTGDEVTFGLHGPRVRFEFGGAATNQSLRRPVAGTGTVPAPPADLTIAAGGAAYASTQPAPMAPQAFRGTPLSGPPFGVANAGTALIHAAPAGRPDVHAAAPGRPVLPSASAGTAMLPSPQGGTSLMPHVQAATSGRPESMQAPRPAMPMPPGPPPPSALPPAPPAGQRVGHKTVAAMISAAVNTARGQQGGQPKMNTQMLSAYVDQRVGAATAGQRRTTRVLAGMLVLSLAGLGGLLIWSQSSNDEIDRLRSDLANLPPNDPRRTKIESRLGALHPEKAGFGRTLYDQNKKGIFMLASGGQGFCTAFAVKPSVLATNAHCVLAAQQHNSGNIVALENEGHGSVQFTVTDMHAHPAYRDNDAHALTPDVGIVNISGKSAVVLTMAGQQELAGVGAGDEVYLIGFPGRLMDAQNPVATFLAAHVGRVTASSGRPGSYADNWLVQHDAPTTHGTSGSPVFNAKGHVIAINAGGYLEGDQETVSGRKTEVVKASPYKFGMRIDLLNAILR